MGWILPVGCELVEPDRCLFLCSKCRKPFEGPRPKLGDGRWAVVSFVFCSPACMTEMLKIPIPPGQH